MSRYFEIPADPYGRDTSSYHFVFPFRLNMMLGGAAYPYGDFETHRHLQEAQSSESMNTIKDFNEAFWRDRCCDRCINVTCGLNTLYLKFRSHDVIDHELATPAHHCPNIWRVAHDNNVDVVLRDRVHAKIAISNETFSPSEFAEFADSEGGNYSSPLTESGFIRDGVTRIGKQRVNKITDQFFGQVGEES